MEEVCYDNALVSACRSYDNSLSSQATPLSYPSVSHIDTYMLADLLTYLLTYVTTSDMHNLFAGLKFKTCHDYNTSNSPNAVAPAEEKP